MIVSQKQYHNPSGIIKLRLTLQDLKDIEEVIEWRYPISTLLIIMFPEKAQVGCSSFIE